MRGARIAAGAESVKQLRMILVKIFGLLSEMYRSLPDMNDYKERRQELRKAK